MYSPFNVSCRSSFIHHAFCYFAGLQHGFASAKQAGGPGRSHCAACTWQHCAAWLPCCASGKYILVCRNSCFCSSSCFLFGVPVLTSGLLLRRRALPALHKPILRREQRLQQQTRASAWHSCSSCLRRKELHIVSSVVPACHLQSHQFESYLAKQSAITCNAEWADGTAAASARTAGHAAASAT